MLYRLKKLWRRHVYCTHPHPARKTLLERKGIWTVKCFDCGEFWFTGPEYRAGFKLRED